MRPVISLFLIGLFIRVGLAQNAYQQRLINDINAMTAEINFYPEQLYVERAEAIYRLNVTRAHQTWVPFTLKDALNDIDCAIELTPDDPHLYSLRAEYTRNIKVDYSAAVKDMNRAIALDPYNPQWYMQRANYRKLEKACVDYQLCADLHDKTCQVIVNEACTQLISGNFK